jgi:hypothetical protein
MDDQSHGVIATTMALRERTMEYFKGTCIARLTNASNIRLEEVPLPPGRLHQYIREQHQREDARLVKLGSVHIMTLKRAPDTITFHMERLNRSKELRAVHLELEKFVSSFLMGVQKDKTKPDAPKGKKSDKELISQTTALMRAERGVSEDEFDEFFDPGLVFSRYERYVTTTAVPAQYLRMTRPTTTWTDVPF